MTQAEQDRIYGRVVREEREARRRFECLKNKAREIVDVMTRISENFVHDVLERRITDETIDALPDKQELAGLVTELQEADADLAEKMQRRMALDDC